jgi:hypothetical protein
MFGKTLAVASVLGSAALAAVAVVGPHASALPVPAGDATAVKTTVNAANKVTSFQMVRSEGAVKADCIPKAKAKVWVEQTGPVEVMKVEASGLPKNTEFDFFVLQVPDFPFGLAWYQGDLETDHRGVARGTFVGRFNAETFSVAVGRAPAPVLHKSPFPDAKRNPATAPVHQFHLGFWFNSPEDADKAGCGDLVTPFNGEHNAGAQAMSTRQFDDEEGPLGQIES